MAVELNSTKGGDILTDTVALRLLIQRSGLKYKYIAQVLGITPYALQRKIDNYNEFKVSEVDSLCNLLGISLVQKDQIFFSRS